MSDFDKNALLAAVEHIPALPQLVSSINAIDEASDSAGYELQKLLASNEDLDAKLLKVVNAIYYAYPDPIASISEAAALLGYTLTRNLLIATAFIDSFRQPGKVKFDRARFWKHSLATARTAKEFAEAEGGFSEEETRDLYLAALFHDFGMIILESFFPEMFQRVLEGVASGKSYVEAETASLGEWGHPAIGRDVATQWGMPASLVEAVAFHHSPAACADPDMKRFVSLIHLAHYGTELAGFGIFAGGAPAPFDATIYNTLSLTKETVKQLTIRQLDAKDEINEIATILIAQSGAAALAKKAARPKQPAGKKK
ncbi:MAG TPA: HDOD domain-containing protein [Spirochaetota bacterium]|nr:HDOD domain-containing protein [Spirochaetota bacterium]